MWKFIMTGTCLMALAGCAQIMEQQRLSNYHQAMAACGSFDAREVFTSSATIKEKSVQQKNYNNCMTKAVNDYYPQYTHLWMEHFAFAENEFKQALDGDKSFEEVKLNVAKSYSDLNEKAAQMDFQQQRVHLMHQQIDSLRQQPVSPPPYQGVLTTPSRAPVTCDTTYMGNTSRTHCNQGFQLDSSIYMRSRNN